MKKLLLFLGVAISSYASNGLDTYPSGGQQSTGNSLPSSSMDSSYMHLSEQEQQFAAQLSDMHRTMFCRHFSVSQRLRAMTLAFPDMQGFTDNAPNIMPDEAVEIVMQDARQGNSQLNSSATMQQQGQRQKQNPKSNNSDLNNMMNSPMDQ